MNTNNTAGQNTQRSSDEKIDLKQDLREVKESVSKTAQHAKEKASDLLGDAQNKASDLLNQAQEKTSKIQESVVLYVKDNPVKALGIALLAGFITAILVRK